MHETIKKMSVSQVGKPNSIALQVDYSSAIAALINVRSILFMLIPQLTFLTVFTVSTSASPLFVLSNKIADHLPALLNFDAVRHCREEEKEKWAFYMSVTTIFFINSRLITAMVALYQTLLSIGILYSSTYFWILSSLFILLPMSAIRSFNWILALGRAMAVRDIDIKAAACGICK